MDTSAIISLIGIVITAVVGPAICAFVGYKINKRQKYDDRKERERLEKEEQEKKYVQESRDENFRQLHKLIEDMVDPINVKVNKLSADITNNTNKLNATSEKLDELSNDISHSRQATISALRALLKNSRDKYVEQGWADSSDKASWNNLYNDYKELGGNHFKEYVNSWKEDVNDLPKEKVEDTKKQLNENK